MPSPSQLRAARGMLDWSREDLALASGLTSEGIMKIERGLSRPQRGSEEKLIRTFLDQGIIFTDNDGVQRHNSTMKVYQGSDAFAQWYEDVYETVCEGGEIFVTGASEADYSRWLSKEADDLHTQRMNAISDKVSCQVILCEGDIDFAYSSYVTYRWINREHWDRNSLYVYGNKSAIIEFSESGPTVTMIDSPAVTRAFRKIFEMMWTTCRDIPTRRAL